eukprot:TRINITY_DN1817_c0_g1_i1.p1 TRINITY_DN1817_c0_g1~~TRINITY_DN1817_c0_g1_i1.p1  ORF type:complete len:127 (+),score=41.89 TRINITY_DN1817_c0_g1_i1:675-1055(+)
MDFSKIDPNNPRVPRFDLSLQPEIYASWRLHQGGNGPAVTTRWMATSVGAFMALTGVTLYGITLLKNRNKPLPVSLTDKDWAAASLKRRDSMNHFAIEKHVIGSPVKLNDSPWEERDGVDPEEMND